MANVEIYTKETCPYCHRAKALLSSKGVSFQELPIDGNAAKRRRDDQTQRSHHGSPDLLTHSTLAAVMTCMHWMHVVDWILLK